MRDGPHQPITEAFEKHLIKLRSSIMAICDSKFANKTLQILNKRKRAKIPNF